MGHLDFEILDVRGLGDDGAVVLGRWRLTDTPEAGAGVFSLAFLRTGEGWRIVHDHTSADAAKAADPAAKPVE
jgi:ketosteroid isomerase-like protein